MVPTALWVCKFCGAQFEDVREPSGHRCRPWYLEPSDAWCVEVQCGGRGGLCRCDYRHLSCNLCGDTSEPCRCTPHGKLTCHRCTRPACLCDCRRACLWSCDHGGWVPVRWARKHLGWDVSQHGWTRPGGGKGRGSLLTCGDVEENPGQTQDTNRSSSSQARAYCCPH